MKNKLIYLGITLCLILGFTACGENDNWVVVTDVQPGTYVSGSAVVYKTIAPAASFKVAPIDTDASPSDVKGITSLYTWLRADGDLFITKADEAGNLVNYGKGDAISDVTNSLVIDGSSFKVPTEGLYLLIYNEGLNQLTILDAKYGLIGGATPGGWDAISPFTSVVFDESKAVVEFKGTYPLTKDQLKFKFNGNDNGGWGQTIPYDGSSTLIIHTNLGSTADEDGDIKLGEGTVELKGGGKNFAIEVAAAYDVTLKLDLRTGKFSVSAEQGEIIVPEYPENLYMNGDEFGGENWDWNSSGIVTMIPVNGKEGSFWCVNYFTAGKGFKWAPQKGWGGDFAELDEVIGYKIVGGNAQVETDGLYVIYIDMPAGKIAIEPAKVFGIGNAFGSWEMGDHPFTINGDKMTIAVAANTADKDGGLRMYANSTLAPAGDWWRMEFIITDGKIVYRGNSPSDPARVDVTAGQTVTLDFKAGTGKIE